MRLRGEVPLDEVLAEVDDVVAGLERLVGASDLPDDVDHDAIDAFLVDAHERAWAGELDP